MFVGWYNPDLGPLFLQVRPMTFQPMIAVVGVLVSVSGCFFFHAHFIAGSQFVSYEHEAPGERDQGVGGENFLSYQSFCGPLLSLLLFSKHQFFSE